LTPLVCDEEIEVFPLSGSGGIPHASNRATITSARDFARRIRPEIVTGYEVRYQEEESTPESEDRQFIADNIELVPMNEELSSTDEVYALDHYLDKTTWYSETGKHHSYNYGVDVRVQNWRTMRNSPITRRNESFEFSKASIGVLRHHNVSGR
jgi:hypothetical protein